MKRRQRRPVLTLNKPQSNCHIEHTQNKCKPANNVQSAQNEASNPLANLCQYNSDSDTEDPKKDVQKLDDQVNDFLKEIQLIAPEQSAPNTVAQPSLATETTLQSTHLTNQQTLWQECYDKSTGYPYYWHTETNEVTWEMPEELRLIKKQSEMGSGVKHSTQGTRWMDFSSITYRQSQASIPEGMIPQEVVARNRNRFRHNEASKKINSEVKTETKKESPTKDDDSDDGRIEMITSFGSDGSDSEDEENSADEKRTSSMSRSSDAGFTSYPTSGEFGPVLCPTGTKQSSLGASQSRSYKPDSVSSSTNKSDERKVTKSDSKSNQAEEKQLNPNKKDAKTCNDTSTKKLELNVSLVPGYGDDSDGEEEVKPRQEVKPLFPISQNEYTNPPTSSFSTKSTHSGFAKSSDVTQDRCNDDSNENGIEDKTKLNREKTEEKEPKADEEKTSKTNIFLEDMQQVCGKAFQRKKRIAFDVTSAKKPNNVSHDNNTVQDDNNGDLTSNEAPRSNNTEESDAGTQNPSCTESKKERDETTKETTEQCVDVSASTEEKSDSKDELCDSAEVPAERSNKAADAEEKDNGEMAELSQILTEKLKFLSEGRESVSAVQTMQIQLQTLSAAWTAGSLEESYFQKWLTSTNHDLERLEEDVAPDGWLCQWDRSHKRYYYHNTSTGTSQWTYPDTGIAGGTEEMELCTTPPPESEELPVAELPGMNETKEKETDETDGNKETNEESAIDGPTDQPPSKTCTNSSSLPSRMIATESKNRKRRDRPDEKALDVKRKRLGTMHAMNPTFESLSYVQAANHSNMEPLPPGVDLSDTSYEATTLKGIIYSTASQQGNAIYAPSIGNPTIPILSHQAGLLQESFVHYPAFHQHLHNVNTIAIANKHSGQNTVQLMVGYAPTVYTNKIIAKPPVKASKEGSLGSALDSFYNDIARIEKTKQMVQHQDVTATTSVEQAPVPPEETKPEIEPETVPNDTTTKERKKKKARLNNKKHKEVSTMVAKWQKAQKNLEDTV